MVSKLRRVLKNKALGLYSHQRQEQYVYFFYKIFTSYVLCHQHTFTEGVLRTRGTLVTVENRHQPSSEGKSLEGRGRAGLEAKT